MPHKRITWVGLGVILAAGVFSFWSLFQARGKFLPTGSRYQIATFGAFAALAITVAAIVLWYYFSEKSTSGTQPPQEQQTQGSLDLPTSREDGRKTNDTGGR